ncbi:MAG: hypothetical protein ACKO37_08030 [Vampirovibrionales bacterium]
MTVHTTLVDLYNLHNPEEYLRDPITKKPFTFDHWVKLLSHLEKIEIDNEPIAMTTILDVLGLKAAIFCLNAVDIKKKGFRKKVLAYLSEEAEKSTVAFEKTFPDYKNLRKVSKFLKERSKDVENIIFREIKGVFINIFPCVHAAVRFANNEANSTTGRILDIENILYKRKQSLTCWKDWSREQEKDWEDNDPLKNDIEKLKKIAIKNKNTWSQQLKEKDVAFHAGDEARKILKIASISFDIYYDVPFKKQRDYLIDLSHFHYFKDDDLFRKHFGG